MSTATLHEIAVEPIIHYPQTAEPGKSYLMTVDLRPVLANLAAWPYEREEYVVNCRVNAGNLFKVQSLGDATIVVHRFGGTYGPARFMLKAVNAEQEGNIKISLFNGWGVPLDTIEMTSSVKYDADLGTSRKIITYINDEENFSNSPSVDDHFSREPLISVSEVTQDSASHNQQIDINAIVPPVEQTILFSALIDELQSLQIQSEGILNIPLTVANRLLYGAYYFLKLVILVRNTIYQTEQDDNNRPELKRSSVSLYQILPSFISLQRSTYTSGLELESAAVLLNLQDSLRDNRLEMLIRSPTNPFVPYEILSMKRDIRLLQINTEANKDNQVKCSYRFRDAAIVNRIVARGDWIAIDKLLFRVANEPVADKNILVIELDPNGERVSLDKVFQDTNGNPKYVNANYYAAIDPLKYYFEMLSLYLQHLIFAYSPITKTTRDRVDIFALLKAFEIGPKYQLHSDHSQPGNPLHEIYARFVQMLVRLTLHDAEGSEDAEGSYYNQFATEKQTTPENETKLKAYVAFNKVQNDAMSLYQAVLKMLGLNGFVLEDHPAPLEQVSDEFAAWVNELTFNETKIDRRISIEEIIKRSGQIGGEIATIQPQSKQP